MSIQSNFPAINPTLNLSFALTKALDPRITFTRASTATFYGTQTAKAEENLLLQSQTFDTVTAWANSGTTVAANTGDTTAPDGTSTAEEITASAGAAVHVIDAQAATYSTINGAQYAYSVFAKKGTLNFIQLYVQSDGTTHANFDLDTGVVGTTGGTVTTAITSVGNGWYRCSMIFTAGGTDRRIGIALVNSSSATRRLSWTAAGTEDVYLWGAQAEQRDAVTAYTATTTQPITNYIPVLQTAAAGVARFDHNPITFESLGLEIEESRTNLLTYSEQFDNGAWTKTRASITANTVVAPDGTLTGDKLVEDTTATNTHGVNQTFSFSTGNYAYSIYAKAGERTFLQPFRSSLSIDAFTHIFNLTAGTAAGTGATIVAVGNGWYRCSGVINVNTAHSGSIIFGLNNGTTNSYTGDGYSGIYIWGAQLEAGAFPTSYIQTVASQVTRAADAASMTGANFSSWYRADEGTIYQDANPYVTGGNSSPAWVTSGDSVTNNGIGSFLFTTSHLYVVVNGAVQANIDAGTATAKTDNKIAAAYKVDDFAAVISGGTVGTDTSGTLPVVDRVMIGRYGPTIMSGTIKKIAYYPSRLTNAQLQALTQN
jgi:hypothetical protein